MLLKLSSPKRVGQKLLTALLVGVLALSTFVVGSPAIASSLDGVLIAKATETDVFSSAKELLKGFSKTQSLITDYTESAEDLLKDNTKGTRKLLDELSLQLSKLTPDATPAVKAQIAKKVQASQIKLDTAAAALDEFSTQADTVTKEVSTAADTYRNDLKAVADQAWETIQAQLKDQVIGSKGTFSDAAKYLRAVADDVKSFGADGSGFDVAKFNDHIQSLNTALDAASKIGAALKS